MSGYRKHNKKIRKLRAILVRFFMVSAFIAMFSAAGIGIYEAIEANHITTALCISALVFIVLAAIIDLY